MKHQALVIGFRKVPLASMVFALGAASVSCKTRPSQEAQQNKIRNPFDNRDPLARLQETCKETAVGDGLIRECKTKDEEALIKQSVEIAVDLIMESKAAEEKAKGTSKGVLFKRDAHPKHHGCIKGTFSVGSGLPNEFQVGVFAAPGASYPVWARMSNAGLKPGSGSDDEPDARGMALKVIGVPGPRLSPFESSKNLDFLLVNIPFFVAKDIKDYNAQLQFSKTLKKNPLKALDTAVRTELLTLVNKALSISKMENPLGETYFSISSFQLGEQVVNYRSVPCTKKGPSPGNNGATGDNKFRDAMKTTLNSEDACYEIQARRLLIPSWSMVENLTNDWDYHVRDAVSASYPLISKSEFEKEVASTQEKAFTDWTTLAEVNFQKQSFDNPDQDKFCENISFNVWRTLPDMRPLGNLNRARKAVYSSVAAARHKGNQEQVAEPTGLETFP